MKLAFWWAGGLLALLMVAPVAVIVTVTVIVAPVASTWCGHGSTQSTVWAEPLDRPYRLTSGFGWRRHPVDGVRRLHNGQDLAASSPQPAAVLAAASGVIADVSRTPVWGLMVTIDHGDGLVTRYAHLARTAVGIRQSASVVVGKQLGVEGASGEVTGRHLHFEVRQDGVPVDPVPFMAAHGAPLNGRPGQPAAGPAVSADVRFGDTGEGGVGFPLPEPGTPRRQSRRTSAAPIPADVRRLYLAAGTRYGLPWTLLAGIGMEETRQGAAVGTSSAGARGLMQFLPATFAAYGVDGSGDGRADIDDPADSIYSAANYLTRSDVTAGPAGVLKALHAYNPAAWYANDVLHYAHAYGGGTVAGDPSDCPAPPAMAGRALPPIDNTQVAKVLAFAASKAGGPYRMGAAGPTAYDCSSLVQAAYARIGVQLPRTAAGQRNWAAAGHATRIPPGREQPGDLLFWDSYLGPNTIGHVALVWNPATHTTIEAHNTRAGIGHFTYRTSGHHRFEIWRIGHTT